MLADAIVVKYIRSIIKYVSTRESDHHDGNEHAQIKPEDDAAEDQAHRCKQRYSIKLSV